MTSVMTQDVSPTETVQWRPNSNVKTKQNEKLYHYHAASNCHHLHDDIQCQRLSSVTWQEHAVDGQPCGWDIYRTLSSAETTLVEWQLHWWQSPTHKRQLSLISSASSRSIDKTTMLQRSKVLQPSTYWSLHCIPKKKKRRASLICDLRYVFINFSLEKLCWQVATEVHIIKIISRATVMIGNISVKLHLTICCSTASN